MAHLFKPFTIVPFYQWFLNAFTLPNQFQGFVGIFTHYCHVPDNVGEHNGGELAVNHSFVLMSTKYYGSGIVV